MHFLQVTSPPTAEANWALATLVDTVAKATWGATVTTVSVSYATPGLWHIKTFTETATYYNVPRSRFGLLWEFFKHFFTEKYIDIFFFPPSHGPIVHVLSLVRQSGWNGQQLLWRWGRRRKQECHEWTWGSMVNVEGLVCLRLCFSFSFQWPFAGWTGDVNTPIYGRGGPKGGLSGIGTGFIFSALYKGICYKEFTEQGIVLFIFIPRFSGNWILQSLLMFPLPKSVHSTIAELVCKS